MFILLVHLTQNWAAEVFTMYLSVPSLAICEQNKLPPHPPIPQKSLTCPLTLPCRQKWQMRERAIGQAAKIMLHAAVGRRETQATYLFIVESVQHSQDKPLNFSKFPFSINWILYEEMQSCSWITGYDHYDSFYVFFFLWIGTANRNYNCRVNYAAQGQQNNPMYWWENQ